MSQHPYACAFRSLLSASSLPDAEVVRALNALGAHEDLRQRALVEQILRARPQLLAPYLASMPSAWEPRASFRFLALHAHLARFLGAVPIAALDDSAPPEAALTQLLPDSLSKKELSRALLHTEVRAAVVPSSRATIFCLPVTARARAQSTQPLVRRTVLLTMVAVLERFARLTESASDDAADALQFAMRQRLPEVQTLVGLRARLDPAVIPAESNAHQCEQQYALLLVVLRRYDAACRSRARQ